MNIDNSAGEKQPKDQSGHTRSPLTNLRDCWPRSGESGERDGYLLQQLDPFNYAGRLVSDGELEDGLPPKVVPVAMLD